MSALQQGFEPRNSALFGFQFAAQAADGSAQAVDLSLQLDFA